MRISVIIAHPNKNSFNYAISNTVVERLSTIGHEVFFHDLYEEKFDAIITGYELVYDASKDKLVEQHCIEIRKQKGSL